MFIVYKQEHHGNCKYTLDDLIGGGVAVGSVILVEEDLSGNYSRLLLKYFLSAGLADQHSLLVTNSSPGTVL